MPVDNGDRAAAAYLAFFAPAGNTLTEDRYTPDDDPVIEYLGHGAVAVSTGAITVALPAVTLQANDLLILYVENANNAVSTPTGWTSFTQMNSGPVGSGTRLSTFWKRATGSGDTGANVGDTGDHTAGVIFAFRGAKATGTPIVSRSAGASTAVTERNITALTGVTKRSMLIFLCASDIDQASIHFDSADPEHYPRIGNDHNYAGYVDLDKFISHSVGNGGAVGIAMGAARSTRNYSSPSNIAYVTSTANIAVGVHEILAA